MDYEELLQMAVRARNSAYMPYSHFSVGAALLCADGTVYTGSNIENAAYTPTVCAERVAFFKAVSEGKRDFTAIAIAGGKEGRAPDRRLPAAFAAGMRIAGTSVWIYSRSAVHHLEVY